MLNTYERHIITGHLSNMANRFDRESPEAGGIVEWSTENSGLFGFDRRSFDVDSEPFDSKEEMSAKQWRVCRRILDQAAESTAAVRYDWLMRRLRRLGRIIKLSAEEISVLQLLLRYQTQPEFEDLLSEDSTSFPLFGMPRRRRPRGAMSKVFMNRLLEDNATPTLWTTNAVHDMSAAILRRMIYALEMRLPPPRIRARIWARQLAQHDIGATDTNTRTLAHEFDAPPGVAAGATAAADLGAGGFDLVRRSVRSLSRVLGCERVESLRSTVLDLPAGTAGHGQERLRPLPGRSHGPGGDAQARFRPHEHVGGWNGAEHRPRFRGGARYRGVPDLRRGGLAARGPAWCSPVLGGCPGQ